MKCVYEDPATWPGNTLRHVRCVVLLTSAAVLALGVTACSGSGDSRVATAIVTHVRGLPSDLSPPPSHSAKPFARWARSHQDYVTTWGSGSCPMLPTSVRADGAHKVRIKTAQHGGPDCTADLGPTTSGVELPDETDDSAALVVTIDGTSTQLRSRAR